MVNASMMHLYSCAVFYLKEMTKNCIAIFYDVLQVVCQRVETVSSCSFSEDIGKTPKHHQTTCTLCIYMQDIYLLFAGIYSTITNPYCKLL